MCICIVSQSLVSYTEYNADWPFYSNIEELLKDSDVVIVAKAIDYETYELQVASEKNPGNKMIITKAELAVDDVLKGKLVSKTISIEQVGGSIGFKSAQMSDDPVIQQDDVMVLFLEEYEEGLYRINGGPQGRYPVINGKVYSLGELYSDSYEATKHLATGGVSITEFIN